MVNPQNSGVSPKVATRRVSLPLAIGITFLPIVFSWLLVRDGHSKEARVIGLSWAGLMLAALVIIITTPPPKEPTNALDSASATDRLPADHTNEKIAEKAPVLPAPKATTPSAPTLPSAPTMDPERRRGMHCLNNWDGSHWDMQNEIKRRLRDPDSFEHIETRIAPIDEVGNHAIFMSFRARNGFGGMNVGQAIGAVDNAQCELIIMHM